MSDTPTATAPEKLPKDRAAELGMVNVQVDGVWRQFPKGTRVIEACRQAGTIVPHYCYHAKLSSPGSCRMCLVQVGQPARPAPGQEPQRDADGYEPILWAPRPIIACANSVAENMGIRTSSELVETCRRGVMEFLLINHPLDCPICDQAGECLLQEHAVGHGRGSSRFAEMKVKKPKNVEIGPRVRLDDERCILCSRCIRFMDEVAGNPVLGFTQRGTHTTLTVHPGHLLDSNYSLNTVDICPVGALTSTDFRFQMRVWFLKETQSIDVNCGHGSNITVWTRSNQIHRITPRQNNEVNSCWMPDSHRLSFHALDGPARFTAPMVKNGTQHDTVSWDDALAHAKPQLMALRGKSIAIIASARMTNEELFLTRELATQLQTPHLAWVTRQRESDGLLVAADRNPNTTGAKLILGIADPDAALDKIRDGIRDGSIHGLLVMGEDPITEGGFHFEDLAKLQFLLQTQVIANPTALAAQVVLPAASFAEKRGSMINLSGRIQCLNRALDPPGDARDDTAILRDLLAAVAPEAPAYPPRVDDIFAAMAAAHPELKHLTLGSIGALGIPVLNTGYQIPLLEKERARKAAGAITG